LVFSSCEKKQVADPANLTLSFEYREVVNDIYKNKKVEIRSTSTPSFVAPDIWYDWGAGSGIAIMIGDGHRFFNSTGTYKVNMLYKPVVEPNLNAIHASRTFSMQVTGVPDSVWHAAVPIE
jgi:hypothetical protein